MMKQTSGKWQRVPVPISATGGNSWERQINAIWKVQTGKKCFWYSSETFSQRTLVKCGIIL